uniref:Uncharacterized protein n=1 Tax=Nymphaea colorata TaxID=210225 RepID=A0A5K1GLR0_9MAGN
MEDQPLPMGDQEGPVRFSSCWGNLKGRFRRWFRLSRALRRRRFRVRRGGFRYDPLSYAQNFDEGCWEEETEGQGAGPMARFAQLPAARPPEEV